MRPFAASALSETTIDETNDPMIFVELSVRYDTSYALEEGVRQHSLQGCVRKWSESVLRKEHIHPEGWTSIGE